MILEAPQQEQANFEQQLQNVNAQLRVVLEQAQKAGTTSVNIDALKKELQALVRAVDPQDERLHPLRNLLTSINRAMPATREAAEKMIAGWPSRLDLSNSVLRNGLVNALQAYLNPQNAAPGAPQLQKHVRAAMEKAENELKTLRSQVNDAQRTQQRLRAGEAVSALRTADVQQFNKLMGNLGLAIAAQATPEQIAAVLQTVEKNTAVFDKALQSLAAELGGNYPQNGFTGLVERQTGQAVTFVDSLIARLYSQHAEKMQKFFGNIDQCKLMVANFLANLRTSTSGSPGMVDGIFHNAAQQMHFNIALGNYAGANRENLPDEWRQDWSKRYTAWVTGGMRGSVPPIQDPNVSAKTYEQEQAQKDKKANDQKSKVEEAERVKTDNAPRMLVGRENFPATGVEISRDRSESFTVNERFVQIRRNEDTSHFQLRLGEGQWVNICKDTPGVRPNGLRLWAPPGSTSLGDLRLLVDQPTPIAGRMQELGKETAQVTIGSIVQQMAKATILPAHSLVISNNNAQCSLLTPDEAQKKAADAQTKKKTQEFLRSISPDQIAQNIGKLGIEGLQKATEWYNKLNP